MKINAQRIHFKCLMSHSQLLQKLESHASKFILNYFFTLNLSFFFSLGKHALNQVRLDITKWVC